MTTGFKQLDVMLQVRRINKELSSVTELCTGPIENTLFTQAALLASEQRSLAPVSNDDHPGELKESVRVERGAPTAKKAIVIKIKAGGKLTQRAVKQGKSGHSYGYDYARAVEFGTEKMKAEPFFFPVYRARKKEMRAAVRKAVQLAVRNVFK